MQHSAKPQIQQMMLNAKVIKVIFVCVILSSFRLTGQTYTVSGEVSDAKTRETIIGATVRIKDTYKGVVTNLHGFFTLSGISNGTYILELSYLGYKKKEIKIHIIDSNVLLPEIQLQPTKISLDEVTVVELRPEKLGDREVETSIRELSIKAVKMIPTARGDVFRAIKYLPGIGGSSPFSPLVSIRGGDPGENLIMIDGVVLYNPYHVSASAGAFNTNAIKDIELLVGGFGAEYGGRNSSIINVITKDGDASGFHGEFSPSSNHFKGFCEFPVTKNSTMTLATRGYYPVSSNFMMYAQNYFWDFNLSYTLRLGMRNRLSVKFFSSQDLSNMQISKFYQYIANSIEDELFKEAFNNIEFSNSNNWNNNAGTVILRSILTPKLTMRTQLYGSFHRSFNSSEQRYTFEDPETGELIFNDNYSTRFKSNIHDLAGKATFAWKPDGNQTIKFGFEANSYDFFNAAWLDGFDKGREEVRPYLLAGFIESKIKAGPVIFRPGIRYSNYSALDKPGFEPRSNLIVKLPADFEFKAAWGKYYQYLTSINTSEYEFSQMLDYYYPFHNRKPLESYHYITGMNKKVSDQSTLSVDLFYKNMKRLYTFNLSGSAGDNESLGSRMIEGSGFAYGLEAMWLGKYKSVSGWLSYTWSRSERRFPGYVTADDFLSEYDRTHAIKGVMNLQITKNLSYSAGFRFMSGHPATVLRTRQNYFYYDPLSNSLTPSGQYVDEQKNNARLPFYIQLDLGIKKRIRSGFGAKLQRFLNADESYLTVDIYNLTFFYRNIDYYMVPGFDGRYIPFGFNYIPSVGFGYSIKF